MKHPTYVLDPDFAARIRAWRDADPDAGCVTDLDHLVQSARRGNDEALTELHDAFAGSLRFGTAGLRGRMAPGPNRMNTAVVRTAAYALAHTDIDYGAEGDLPRTCVIGYDGRYRSRHFAEQSAAVFSAAGWRAFVMPRALPTPVLAFAVRHLRARLGVMVTASHNPPQDNGYKVYLADGRQIVEPVDAIIADAIEQAPPAKDIPLDAGWDVLPESIVSDYLATLTRIVSSDSPRKLRVVHTALHGVSTSVFSAALALTGFPAPIEVTEQRDADPDFPTVDFPNPEEPGALDLALALAESENADLVIAHDPDGDRCAVAIPTDSGWRMLTGDEVGALIGWWIVQRSSPDSPGGSFATSLVSGTLLRDIASDAGVPFHVTLTGFKWITRAPGLRYGYEEALGYCVDPDNVADKDGISAGLLVAELAASLAATGRSMTSVLDDLARRHGVHLTRGISIRFTEVSAISAKVDHLRSHPPREVGGMAVAEAIDLSEGLAGHNGHPGLPPTSGLLVTLKPDTHAPGGNHAGLSARVIIRPSGTEPKVKAYLQVVVPVASETPEDGEDDVDDGLGSARSVAIQVLDDLVIAVTALLSD